MLPDISAYSLEPEELCISDAVISIAIPLLNIQTVFPPLMLMDLHRA